MIFFELYEDDREIENWEDPTKKLEPPAEEN